ncbi:hypothetical protein FQN52_001037 [Onygenales sp. PD_12]|nr:hypothetical protein FQN52_001037 [Onygenales sp. PD_12]
MQHPRLLTRFKKRLVNYYLARLSETAFGELVGTGSAVMHDVESDPYQARFALVYSVEGRRVVSEERELKYRAALNYDSLVARSASAHD